MSKTKRKKPKELTAKQIANRELKQYIKATAQKKLFEEKQKAAKARLVMFASANTELKNDDGNIELRGGYIHFGDKTVIKPCEGFSWPRFVEEYPELVKNEFKVAPVKNVLDNTDARNKMLANHCVEIKEDEEISIVIDKKE